MSTEWAQPQNLRKKHVIHNLNCPLYRVQLIPKIDTKCMSGLSFFTATCTIFKLSDSAGDSADDSVGDSVGDSADEILLQELRSR